MFEAAIGGLSAVVLVLAGLIARVLLAVLVVAAIAVPIAGLLLAWKGLGALADRLNGLQRLGHVLWRRGCYYTPGHMWVRPAGAELVRVGLDDVAQRILPDVAAVHLPVAGTAVKAGDWLGRIQCAGGAVTLRAPIEGVVESINERLLRLPDLLHTDPYRAAWMVTMRPRDANYTRFASGDTARRWLTAEDRRLTSFFENQLGLAAADGGELIVPPQRLLTTEQWESIRTGFLDAA